MNAYIKGQREYIKANRQMFPDNVHEIWLFEFE